MTTPRWTSDDLTLAVELAWQTGRDYQQRLLDEATDDITHASPPAPVITYEERIAMRLDEMLRSVAPDEYLGGPVDWNAARPQPAAVAAAGLRYRDHDRAILEHAAASRPAFAPDDWAAVRDASTGAVWWRIWWDLSEGTRARHEHLAPPTALRLVGELA